MKTRASIKSHPIHPMLVPYPIAFLTGAFVFDLLGFVLDDPALWTTGGVLAPAGVLTGLVAGVFGLVDYVASVPPASTAKSRATKHMLANLTALVLFAVARAIRGGAGEPPFALTLALQAIGMGALGAGGWMGGTLVVRNFMGPDHRYARAGKWREAALPAPSAPGDGVVAARADELELDQMKLLHVDGRRIVLGRTEEGYVAFDDACTHRGGSLAGGVLLCGTVQCLWHGSQFDVRTGAVKAGPAERPITTYHAVESGGAVRVFLDR
jgi:nitrite reductase/ring-hydroxylating ferredoxin subunit/uncharacterized membrane protein